jgi:hypothetical protein
MAYCTTRHPLVGDLFCKPDNRYTHRPRLSQLLRVFYERCDAPSNVCLDHLLTTLRADASGDVLDDDEFAFDPQNSCVIRLSSIRPPHLWQTP